MGQMVVGDYHVDAQRLGVVHLFKGRDPGVYGDDQSHALFR